MKNIGESILNFSIIVMMAAVSIILMLYIVGVDLL